MFSFIFPRSKDVWIFGSANGSFQDNTKYLYIEMVKTFNVKTCIWIGGDNVDLNEVEKYGGKSYKKWSICGIYYSLRGMYWFVNAYSNDINHYASGNAKIVNLWHGIPYKKIERDIDGGALMKRYLSPSIINLIIHPWLYRKPEWILSPSHYVSMYSFSSAFSIDFNKCLNFGNPRVSILNKTKKDIIRFIDDNGCLEQKRIIEYLDKYNKSYIYMPTWRDANVNFMGGLEKDLCAINSLFKEKNYLLLLKCHPNTPSSALSIFSNMSNILVIANKSDVYPLLPFTDGLITDYSSIMFDYVIVDKPIYLYLFDYDEYLEKSRPSYFDLLEFAPGAVSHNINDLISSLLMTDVNHNRREYIRDIFWCKNHNADASKAIFDFFGNIE